MRRGNFFQKGLSFCPLRGVYTPWADLPRKTPLRQTPPPARQTPLGRHLRADTPLRDGYCSGRYASYWNAFLLTIRMFRELEEEEALERARLAQKQEAAEHAAAVSVSTPVASGMSERDRLREQEKRRRAAVSASF